jgi:hypothetical protein
MNSEIITAGILIAFTAVFVLLRAILKRKEVPSRREIPAFNQLHKALDQSVEEGTRVHVSLGKGKLVSQQGAAGLAGLSALNHLSPQIQSSDLPLLSSSGEPGLSILSQDVLHSSGKEGLRREENSFRQTRLTGLTHFSYAAGTIPLIRNNNISTNVLVGNFGVEVGLIIESVNRNDGKTVAASDDLPGQAVIYANTGESMIGEELFAVSEYIHHTPFKAACLTAQDILRWALVICMLLGAILKLGGVI